MNPIQEKQTIEKKLKSIRIMKRFLEMMIIIFFIQLNFIGKNDLNFTNKLGVIKSYYNYNK